MFIRLSKVLDAFQNRSEGTNGWFSSRRSYATGNVNLTVISGADVPSHPSWGAVDGAIVPRRLV